MMEFTIQEFARNLEALLDRTAQDNETLLIKGAQGNAVVVSEEDWQAINDILQVVSMSGMAESIRHGLQQEISTTAEHLE